jgi:aryl-alcohol dehydrogenase-like predicted oxidoreductase
VKEERMTNAEMLRSLGVGSGVEVGAMGLGCWAIGGPWEFDGRPAGWGAVDDGESVRAIRRALDLGVTFYDTADVYGCGHSERVLGRALEDRRGEAVIATKFGLLFDEETRAGSGADASPTYIRKACEESLRRLRTDYIDVYQLHAGAEDAAGAEDVVGTLEELVSEGKIRAYGTAVDAPEVARVFSEGEHCVAVQTQVNVFGADKEVLRICEERGLAMVCRSPLAMGLLTGKYAPGKNVPPDDDVRRDTPHWDYVDDGAMEGWTEKLEAIREALTEDGRTLAQGSLAWIWAYSDVAIPIPGFKTTLQVEENAGAMRFGPLSEGAMGSIDRTLDR